MTRRTIASAFLALTTSAVGMLTAAAPASADPAPSPVKYINRYDGKCLEADLAHIGTNGDAAQLWDCWNDPGNQQWRIVHVDDRAGTFKIYNEADGKCLESDLAHSGNGTPVQLWTCWQDPGNQLWRSVSVPPTIWYPLSSQRLVNVLTGKCLDADLAHIGDNGDRLQLWDCWNDPGNDQWRVNAWTS